MKALFLVLCLVCGQAFAVSVPMSSTGMVGISGGVASTASNFVGSFSGAAFNNTFTANVGGRPVSMPASMSMAANAGNFAATAVRGAGAGLIGPAVLAWLAAYGLSWLNDQWVKSQTGTGDGYIFGQWCSSNFYPVQTCPFSGSLLQAKQKVAEGIAAMNGTGNCPNGPSGTPGCPSAATLNCTTSNGGSSYSCTGYAYGTPVINKTGTYTPPPSPATDADWAAVNSLTDAAASELANKDVAIPLNKPAWQNPYTDVPLSDPYFDPVTDRWLQDKGRVTPSPDGSSADVEPFKDPVNPDGTPATNPDGSDKPEEADTTQDPCQINPDRLGCLNKGDADQVELEQQNHGSSISPVTVGGAGSCPADKSIAVHGGTAVFSYKPICDLATMINPLVLAFAWLGAGFILIGAFKE